MVFDSLRRRIAALIAGSALLVLVILLGVVFASEYTSARQRNMTMLDRYVDIYTLENAPDDAEPPPDLPTGDADDYTLSSFYSVSFDDAGEVLAVDEGHARLYERRELVRMADEVARQGIDHGTTDSLLFRVERRSGYTLVAFIDNHLVNAGMRRLMTDMLVGAGATLLLILLVSVPLSRALVRPLEESDERQRRFVSDAGHELKTPISVIDVNAEVLARQIGKNRWLDNIRYENRRTGELVSRLLSLSRAQEGGAIRLPIDLSQLVAAEAAPFQSVAAERGLELVCAIADELWVAGDATQLAQLPAILLENAVEYAQAGTEVTLTLRATGPVAWLEVTNRTEGLDAKDLACAFERFFRADRARSDAAGHVGLGLPIAKAIAEGHGGGVELTCREQTVHAVVQLPLQS